MARAPLSLSFERPEVFRDDETRSASNHNRKASLFEDVDDSDRGHPSPSLSPYPWEALISIKKLRKNTQHGQQPCRLDWVPAAGRRIKIAAPARVARSSGRLKDRRSFVMMRELRPLEPLRRSGWPMARPVAPCPGRAWGSHTAHETRCGATVSGYPTYHTPQVTEAVSTNPQVAPGVGQNGWTTHGGIFVPSGWRGRQSNPNEKNPPSSSSSSSSSSSDSSSIHS